MVYICSEGNIALPVIRRVKHSWNIVYIASKWKLAPPVVMNFDQKLTNGPCFFLMGMISVSSVGNQASLIVMRVEQQLQHDFC